MDLGDLFLSNPALQILLAILAYLFVINALTYFIFYADKRSAKSGARRVRESTLLQLTFIGGGLGGYLAQQHFRHKTQKQPFRRYFFAILLLQGTALIVALGVLIWRYVL